MTDLRWKPRSCKDIRNLLLQAPLSAKKQGTHSTAKASPVEQTEGEKKILPSFLSCGCMGEDRAHKPKVKPLELCWCNSDGMNMCAV